MLCNNVSFCSPIGRKMPGLEFILKWIQEPKCGTLLTRLLLKLPNFLFALVLLTEPYKNFKSLP